MANPHAGGEEISDMALRDRYDPGWGYGGPRYPGAFLLALQEALLSLNWRTQRWLPAAVECTDAQGHAQLLGLDNLYRRIRPMDRVGWPGLLADFLGRLPTDPAGALTADLPAVAERLFVRLTAPMAAQEAGVRVWSQALVPDKLAIALVIDAPESMVYVTEKMIADSGQAAEHWRDLALSNLRAHSAEVRLTLAHPESGLLQSETGDAYDASRALLLDTLIPGHEAHGFFVAVPGRDHLLVLPVTYETVAFLPWLRAVSEKTYRDVPYPISAEVFWTHQQQWYAIAIEIQGEQVTVTPPPEFLPVLETLRPPGEEPPQDTAS